MGKRSAFDRREGDFATKHIFAASNLPVALTELRIEALVPRRATPIVLCDAGDGLAPAAAAVMERMGYRALSILDGGIAAWARAGHRLFSGINVPSKAFGEYVERQAGTPHIDPRELERLMQRGEDLIVLDSRPFAEYRFMSIPGAIDCPGGELVYRFFENVPSPGTLVVVNCAGRTRSIIGAQSLIDAGVLNRVVALRDGTMGWRLAGLSLEHGAARRAPAPAAAALAQAQARARAVALRAGVRGASWDEYRAIRADATRTSYLFDVRDPEEFVRAHPEGAVSAPGGQLVQTLDTFAAVRNARIFICDADDVRGAMTAAWLRQIGWADVFHIAGGLAGATLAAASELRCLRPPRRSRRSRPRRSSHRRARSCSTSPTARTIGAGTSVARCSVSARSCRSCSLPMQAGPRWSPRQAVASPPSPPRPCRGMRMCVLSPAAPMPGRRRAFQSRAGAATCRSAPPTCSTVPTTATAKWKRPCANISIGRSTCSAKSRASRVCTFSASDRTLVACGPARDDAITVD